MGIVDGGAVYTYLLLFPNSSDDWTIKSPFHGCLLAEGQTAIALCAGVENSFTSYLAVEEKLLEVGAIDKSIDIFKGVSRDFSSSEEVSGVGCFAKIPDFNFSLENLSADIDVASLLGRKIQVVIGEGTSMLEVGQNNVYVVFTGRIRTSQNGRDSLNLSAKGSLDEIDRLVGTLAGDPEDVDKIIPIVYGDFTDENAAVEIVALETSLVIENKPIEEITSLALVQSDGKVLKASCDSASLNAYNNKLDLQAETNLFLTANLDVTTNVVYLYAPKKIAFLFSEDSSLLQAVSATQVGTLYKDSSNKSYEFLGRNSGYLLFSTVYNQTPVEATGTLTKVQNGGVTQPGPATLTFTFKSTILDSDAPFNLITSLPNGVDTRLTPVSFFDKTESNKLRIGGEEVLLLAYLGEMQEGASWRYLYSGYHVLRGAGADGVINSALKGTAASVVGAEVSRKLTLTSEIYPQAVTKVTTEHYIKSGETNEMLTSNRTWAEVVYAPQQLAELTKMGREGELGEPVLFQTFITNPGKLIAFVDFSFPKIDIDANVVDAHLLGSFYTNATKGITGLTYDKIALLKGGRVVSDPDKGIPSYYNGPLLPPALLLSNFTVGRYSPDVLETYWARQNGVDAGDLVFIAGGWRGNASPMYGDNIERVGWYMNDGNEGNPIPGWDCYYFFDTDYYNETHWGNGLYDVKKWFSLRRDNFPEANGLISNLNVLGETRYSICLMPEEIPAYSAATCNTFSIANFGLLFKYVVDVSKTKIYSQCKGRVGEGSTALTNPVSILKDFLTTELTGASFNSVCDIAAMARAAWQSSLYLSGKRQKTFTALDTFVQENGLIVSENGLGQICVDALDLPTDISDLRVLTDSDFLLDNNHILDWNQTFTPISGLVTDITVSYQQNTTNDVFGKKLLETDYVPGVEGLLESAFRVCGAKQQAQVKLTHQRNASTANKIAQLLLQYSTLPLRELSLEGALSLHSLREGQWVAISSNLLQTSGKAYLVVKHNLQPGFMDTAPSCKVTFLECECAPEYATGNWRFVDLGQRLAVEHLTNGAWLETGSYMFTSEGDVEVSPSDSMWVIGRWRFRQTGDTLYIDCMTASQWVSTGTTYFATDAEESVVGNVVTTEYDDIIRVGESGDFGFYDAGETLIVCYLSDSNWVNTGNSFFA